jgi:hypothetical protein
MSTPYQILPDVVAVESGSKLSLFIGDIESGAVKSSAYYSEEELQIALAKLITAASYCSEDPEVFRGSFNLP